MTESRVAQDSRPAGGAVEQLATEMQSPEPGAVEVPRVKTKGKAVGLSGTAKHVARLFGDEEAEHVTALTEAIRGAGGKPVKNPRFSFPVSDQRDFLKLAYALENTGVGAYDGAGPSLKDKSLLAAAGSIVKVEARHAASIAVLTGSKITASGAFDKPLTKQQVLAEAGPLIK